jgi:acyl-CoA synthetase (AMP-forming)/AMP-acid ligase II
MNLVELLSDHAHTKAEKVALKDCRAGKVRSITYWNLQQQVEIASENLRRAGVKKDSRVLLAVSLSIETYVILLAIFRIGAVAVVADASLGFQVLEQSVSMVKPDAVVYDLRTSLLCLLSCEVRNIRLKLFSDTIVSQQSEKLNVKTSQSSVIENVNEDHPALITFTSGSTGKPKAIVRTHGFLQHQHNVIAKSLTSDPGDVELTTLPVFVLSALAHGITAVLPDCNMRKPASIDATKIAAQIERCEINRIIASPAFLQTLSDFLSSKRKSLNLIRRIYTGGGPVFPALMKQMKTVFPNAELIAVYGSTEAEPIAHIDFGSIAKEDLTQTFLGGGLLAGKPIQDIELRIADFETLNSSCRGRIAKNIPALPPFAIGEILVSGNHVVKTYLDERGNAETKIEVDSQPGKVIWHRTGDAGYTDHEGRLWLMGRCTSKIEDERGEVYPFQVEAAASEINSIRRATCLKSNGKRILIVEKKRQHLPITFARTQTGDAAFLGTINDAFRWLQFDEIRIVDALPVDRRHNAKIQYSQIANRLKKHFPWTWGRIVHHPAIFIRN